ncbi:MAG: hypothetical protein HYT72_03690 [Candidatus Aenigmarchaeota archaeon]|nr:hypothetical protein [Candidatus Aenigmarchaeota archaeon]
MPVADEPLKERVFSCVRREAAPIYAIAREAALSVQTTSKYCHVLQAEHKVEITKFGNMKMVKRR